MATTFGQLAKKWSNMRLPVVALQSNKGFYLGTAHPEEGPISRESLEYFDTAELAGAALANGNWTQRDNP